MESDERKYRETSPVDLHEMSRLISQDRAFNRLMPVIFSHEEWHSFGTVVDLGCGPGGWCLDMAATHPECTFLGVDSSEEMLKQARLLALAEKRHHVSFRSLDILQGLPFEDDSVGYVNGRILSLYLKRQGWPSLLKEIHRILRPGGKIALLDYESLVCTSEALERFGAAFLEAAKHHGLTFSPTGSSTGFSARIQPLLRDAGFSNIRCQALAVDGSSGQLGRDEWVENVFVMSHTFQSFVLATGKITDEELQALRDQAMNDAQDPQFGAVAFFLMAWAEKSSEIKDAQRT